MGIFTEIDKGKLHDHAFFDMTDVPSSSGSGGKYVRVKANETGLEYVTISGGGDVSMDDVNSAIATFSGTIDHNTILNTHNLTTDIDHGSIGGLGDDDHTQYHTDVRGDARYYTQDQIATISGDLSTEIDNDISTHEGGSSHDSRYYTESEITTISGNIVDQIVTDHGGLSGLVDDDHTQYILADGSRAFSSTISGISPTENAHLTTRGYVDTEILTTSGTLQSQITASSYFTSTTVDGGVFVLNEVINVGDLLCKDKTASGGTFLGVADTLLDGGSF